MWRWGLKTAQSCRQIRAHNIKRHGEDALCARAGILNLFGGVLIFKKKAEEALENSGMRYTIVRCVAP